jgi:microcystin-dependent protein
MSQSDLFHRSRKLVFSTLAAVVIMLGALLGSYTAPVSADTYPYWGEIIKVAFNFCPIGWTEANGQTIPISYNQGLFSLIGTTYGGDGQNTFAVPDLRGRLAIGVGQSPGLSNYQLGSRSGSESVKLAVTSQQVNAVAVDPNLKSNATPVVNNVTPASFSTLPPYLTIRYCIATEGIYPSRDY